MPRKNKKSKFKPCKVNQYGEVFTNTRAVIDGTSPIDTLNYFFEIFANRVEKDVIKLILDECDYNVDQASETLMSLYNDENKRLPKNNEASKKSPSLNCNLPLNYNVTLNPDSPEFIFPYPLSKSKSLSYEGAESCPDVSIISEQHKIFRNAHAESFSAYSSCIDGASSNEISPQEVTPSSYHFSNELCDSSVIKKTDSLKINEEATSNCNSNSFENFTNVPAFIVPCVPMHGSPSVRKSPSSETNKGFWNLNDSRNFSTLSNNDSHNSKDHKIIKEVVDKIKSNNNILIILRGLPGSGKSTLALKLKFSGVIFSTDDFFYKMGKYFFDPNQLSEAHEWNKLRTKKALEHGLTPIIIDNTNVEAWEMKPYILLGRKYNYEIVILEPNTPWKFNVNSLSLRNKHNVPKSKIAKMKERYQNDLTVEKILGSQEPISSNIELKTNTESLKLTDVKRENKSHNDSNTPKDNHILFKAVIHTEDNSSFQNLSNHLGFDPKFQEDVKTSNEIQSLNDDEQTNTIDYENFDDYLNEKACSLDELRALAKNDSEDSQSLYSSVNDSLQEISGWEAITERDNDFQWSTSSKELSDNFFHKSRSVDSLNLEEADDSSFVEDGTSSSKNSSENVSCCVNDFSAVKAIKNTPESIQTNSNFHFNEIENDTDLIDFSNTLVPDSTESRHLSQYLGSYISDYHIDEGLKELAFNTDNGSSQQIWSEGHDTDEIINHTNLIAYGTNPLKTSSESLHINEENNFYCKTQKQDLIPAPKPRRSNSEDFIIPKNSFVKQVFQDLPETLEILDSDSDWNDKETKTNESVIESNVISKIDSLPKPQRQIFKNVDVASRFSSEKNTNFDASLSTNKKSLFNISIDSIGQQWEFPEVITDPIPVPENIKKDEYSNKSVHSQTEPEDFDFLYKISFAKDFSNWCDYEVITARVSTDIAENTDDLISTKNSENCMYSVILSFDKSTSTNDLEEDVEISQKLDHLQTCFPDISKDDLLHLLEICCNDEGWLTNLILDWGYKYNVPAEDLENKIKNVNDEEKNYFSLNLFKKNGEIPISETNSSSFDTDDNKSSSSKSQSEEVEEVQSLSESMKTLQLELDPVFACQLEELFGPVSSSGHLVVDIDLELAKFIHEKWKSTATKETTEKNKKEYSDSPKHLNPKNKKNRPIKINSNTSSRRLHTTANKEPSTLSEIMDMEYAHQLYKEEKLKDEDFMTKIKRSELYNMFPGADIGVLDDIFESNNYSLEDSLHAIGPDISEEETIEKKKNVEKFDAHMRDWEQASIFHEFENGDWSDWVYQNDSLGSIQDSSISTASTASPTISSEAAELREAAAKHYQLRQEFIQKAQAAYCRGMKDVASFYAQKGNEQGKIAKDINKQAAALITREKNIQKSCLKLDLHGLHVQEAISLLDKFLSDKKLEIRRRQHTVPLFITVITGQGLHSMLKAKLRPAVINYLKSNKYSFTEIKTGIIEVTVMPE